MKKYLNSTDRQRWLQLFFVGQALEELKDDKKYNTETLKSLRTAFTHLKKSVDLLIKDYPKYARTFANDMDYYRVLFLPKEQAYAEKDKLVKEKSESPLDALYDVLDVTMGELCVGCNGKKECQLRNKLEFYNVPETDEEDKICKWRL